MIISASYRTDIPAFFGPWFGQRRRAGFAWVKNPYGGRPARVDLSPEAVDGYVFWTRNAAPFLAQLRVLRRQNVPFVVHYTLTGYPRTLETATPPADRSIKIMQALAGEFGPRTVVWRYDPIVLTSSQPAAWHLSCFQRLADGLAGIGDEVVVSFMEPYRKTRRNMAIAAKKGQFTVSLPDAGEKQHLADQLRDIAKDRGFALTACSQPELAITPARCIDAVRLSALAGRDIKARVKGNRPGCLCAESRDLGVYDSCAQGCAYCYAVSTVERARGYLKTHDPLAESL